MVCVPPPPAHSHAIFPLPIDDMRASEGIRISHLEREPLSSSTWLITGYQMKIVRLN